MEKKNFTKVRRIPNFKQMKTWHFWSQSQILCKNANFQKVKNTPNWFLYCVQQVFEGLKWDQGSKIFKKYKIPNKRTFCPSYYYLRTSITLGHN